MAEMEVTDARPVITINPQRTGSDQYRLQQMRCELMEELDEIEAKFLLDLLFSKNIFNTIEKNEVFYRANPDDKLSKLLDILESKVDIREDGAILDIVVGFLKHHGKDELAKKLIEANGISERVEEAEEALRVAEGMELTDQILGGVVRNVGPSWDIVAHQLGVNDIKIASIKSVIHEPYQQKFKVFHAWKQQSGYQPGSLIVLLKAFKDNDDQCTVDWSRISTYLQNIKNK